MKNKNYKLGVWFLVILIILVVTLMGFIIYKEFYSKEKTNTNNITNQKQELSDSEQKIIAEKYFNIFTNGSNGFCESVELIPENTKKITINNITNKYKSNIIYWYIINNKMSKSSNEIVISDDKIDLHKILKKDVNEIAFKLFGIKEHIFTEEDLGWISLEKVTDKYYLFSKQTGGCLGYVFGIDLKSYEFNNEKLKLVVSKYTYETDEITNEKLNDTFKSEDYVITLNKNINEYIFESIEKK